MCSVAAVSMWLLGLQGWALRREESGRGAAGSLHRSGPAVTLPVSSTELPGDAAKSATRLVLGCSKPFSQCRQNRKGGSSGMNSERG